MSGQTAVVILGFSVNIFFVGVLGAIAVEIVAWAGTYDTGQTLPEKYRKFGFYASKASLACIGGFLVVVYDVVNLPAAMQIGASVSAMVLALSRRESPPTAAAPPNAAG